METTNNTITPAPAPEEIFLGAPVPSTTPRLEVRAAWQYITSGGRVREQAYRLVFDPVNRSWNYLASRRFRDRRDVIREYVTPGRLLAQHYRGGKIEYMYLVDPDAQDNVIELNFRRVAGGLEVTLPSGKKVIVPDPRR